MKMKKIIFKKNFPYMSLFHQNHSQKIQHVVKIKQENMQLKTEVLSKSVFLGRKMVCLYFVQTLEQLSRDNCFEYAVAGYPTDRGVVEEQEATWED